MGWNLPGEGAAVIVFVMWGTAEMGDLVRSALLSIPGHQYESSEALGFSRTQAYFYIILPQTLRRLIPVSINLITRMIKTTSLILMIGVVEVLKVGQQIIEANRMSSPNAAFGVFLVIFLCFVICWSVSMTARYLEKKWSLGPSGCGKSTLLRCINGLEEIQSGSICVQGKEIPGIKESAGLLRQKLGMLFQSYDLFPHLSVLGNIMLSPVKVQKRKKDEVKEEALELWERVGLSDKADSYPRQLSGGQKQRVAIVRALILHPEILLFDEVNHVNCHT